jgi:phenylpropionate dioxygenase-like ring-hydroxylating dioxygenase large terminal subunit
MSIFVKNAWYVAAWDSEVGRELFKRRILGEPVVLYRKEDGTPVALIDRCAHKLVPLSMGKLVGDHVQCGYHGLQFDCSGKCVNVPGQDRIPPTAMVRSFPVIERNHAIWIWMGDPALADPALIHAMLKLDDPAWTSIHGGYQHHFADYLNIAENLQDPAHTTFAHAGTIGNPAASEVPVKVEHEDGHVVSFRWTNNAPPPPIDQKIGKFEGLADRCQYYHFFAPCVSRVDVVTMNAGQEHTEENMNKGLRAFSYKFLTPETETTTHFFWMHVRNFGLGDADLEANLIKGMNQTFDEDNVIVGALQREQAATGVRQYTWLAVDAGPARVRKMLEEMVLAESQAAA